MAATASPPTGLLPTPAAGRGANICPRIRTAHRSRSRRALTDRAARPAAPHAPPPLRPPPRRRSRITPPERSHMRAERTRTKTLNEIGDEPYASFSDEGKAYADTLPPR